MKKTFLVFLMTVSALFAAFAEGDLPRLAVVEFTANPKDDKTAQDAVTVRSLVESNVIATGKYQIVTRSDIDKLLSEQRIQLSSISSKESRDKLGIAKINYIITGELNAMGSDYAIALKILDVSNGQFSHSANDFMGGSSRELYTGVNKLVTSFIAGMGYAGGQIMQTEALKAAAASASDTGIRVTAVRGGVLYFQGGEVADLFDNDTHLIPVPKAGTYTLKMRFVDGKESTRAVTITGRGIVDLRFGGPPPPPQGLRTGTATFNSMPLSWNSAGAGITYKVYYSAENNPERAQTPGGAVSGTSTTVSNLEANKAYYFWVSSIELGIEGAKGSVVSEKTPLYGVGSRGAAGGWVFYDKGSYSDGWRYLEAAPSDVSTSVEWGAYQKDVSGTSTAIGSGKQNTQLIVNYLRQTGESGRAAQLCIAYSYGGVSDWFLPSKDELNLMYTNLKAKGLGALNDKWYWSSSPYGTDLAWGQIFSDGSQARHFKNSTGWVRAVRAF